jgi:hypothetical protein
MATLRSKPGSKKFDLGFQGMSKKGPSRVQKPAFITPEVKLILFIC